MTEKVYDPHRLHRYREHMADVQAVTATSDSARMAIASAYQQAGNDGFDSQAMKFVRKLLRMEPTARRARWDEILLGIEATNCLAQEELAVGPTEVAQPGASADQGRGEGEGDVDDEQPPEAEGPAPAEGEKPPVLEAPSADEQRDLRELGRRAGLAGHGSDKNPCEATSLEAQQWETGRIAGEQELVDRQTASQPGNQRPRKGRGAIFTTEGTTAVN